MGTTKTEHFTAGQNALALSLKALGHPARVAIMEYLMRVDKCICGDIVNELPLAQATVSQHLRELKTAGLIKGNIEGNAICYCVNLAAVAEIKAEFDRLFKLNSSTGTCCAPSDSATPARLNSK